MDESAEMVAVTRAEWEAMEARLAAMERRLAGGHASASSDQPGDGRTDRRGLLKHGAMLAAGAVAGGAVAMAAGGSPAEAANGASLVLGSVGNGATVATGLEVTGSEVIYGIGVTDNGLGSITEATAGAVLGHAKNEAFQNGVAGYAQNGAIGVLGTSDTGFGVSGVSGSGFAGVTGSSGTSHGVVGQTLTENCYGVYGIDQSGFGGVAVYGQSDQGIGVMGITDSSDNPSSAVLGQALGTGPAVQAEIFNLTSSAAALLATTNGTGPAVQGQITHAASAAAALSGVTVWDGVGHRGPGQQPGQQPGWPAGDHQRDRTGGGRGGHRGRRRPERAGFGGTGTPILGQIINPANTQPGDLGHHQRHRRRCARDRFRAGTGVSSKGTGRGAILAGGAAQAQFTPGNGTTHPTSGQTGDFYVDSTARLWFCTVGGTTATWTQLA